MTLHENPRYDETVRTMLLRVDATVAEEWTGFPHYADLRTGRWIRTDDGFWTGGFWGGLLALSCRATDGGGYAQAADRVAERVAVRAASDTAFRGFLFWYGAAVDHLLTKSSVSREAALAGAQGLARSYNADAGVIPLGTNAEEAGDVGRGAANIDAVPGTVPLLAWAAEELDCPDMAKIANNHAERHVEYCVRQDGSVCQSAAFDERTGAMLRRYTHKGLHDDSTWARAQAWAMLAYAQAGQWLSPDFLSIATHVSDWWLHNAPADHVARWDFAARGDPSAPRDTSATAIAAAALLKLSVLLPDRPHYRDRAREIVEVLITDFLTPVGAGDERQPGMLTAGCFDKRHDVATNNELVWGDFFLLESILMLGGVLDPVIL